MNLEIRHPLPGDIGWVISMHGKTYDLEFDFQAEFEVDIAKKMIALCDKQKEFLLWIAEANGVRVGSIAVSKLSNEIAFLNFMLVLKEFRGKGIADRLMDEAINNCKSNNYRTIRLETYSCLEDARKFYKRRGYCLKEVYSDIEKYGHAFDQEFWELQL